MTKEQKNNISTELLEDLFDLINENSTADDRFDAMDNMLYIVKRFSSNQKLVKKINALTKRQSGDVSVYELAVQDMLRSIGDKPTKL